MQATCCRLLTNKRDNGQNCPKKENCHESIERDKENAVDYSMNAITDICTNIGPRESGMPKEREAQEWIKNQIDTNGWADESAIEDFKVSRHALVGFTKIIGVF